MMRKRLVLLIGIVALAAPAAAFGHQGPHADAFKILGERKANGDVVMYKHPRKVSCNSQARHPRNVAPPQLSVRVHGPARAAFHYTCSHQTTWWFYNGWWHRLIDQGWDPYGHWHQYEIVDPGGSVSHFRIFYCTLD